MGSCITSILLSSHVHSFFYKDRCTGDNQQILPDPGTKQLGTPSPITFFFFLRTTFTPSTDTMRLTFFFLMFLALNSYCGNRNGEDITAEHMGTWETGKTCRGWGTTLNPTAPYSC